MGFIDELKRLARPYEDEDEDNYDDFDDTGAVKSERREKPAARSETGRVLDFLAGVAYAQEGKIKKVAARTYIITPYNVDILGDLIDELENNGLYF